MTKQNLEICISPALFDLYDASCKVVVVVDIFRATTAICTAFDHGVSAIIPVAGLEDARAYQKKGYLIAAERDGIKPDFADFGNSPFNFMKPELENTTIVYSTTNGTKAIQLAASSEEVVIASFINLSAVANHLANSQRDVIILCAGWKNRLSLEDTLFAGALGALLIEHHDFKTDCDSVTAAMELWHTAKDDLMAYQTKFAHTHRLKKLMLDDVVEFCLTPDQTLKIPLFVDGVIRCK
jgi:2-phosphosulfolactate phosphatase